MKHFALILISFSMLAWTYSASALVGRGVNNPVMTSQLKVETATGVFTYVNTAELTLLESIQGQEVDLVSLKLNNESESLLKIENKTDDGCGSVMLVASELYYHVLSVQPQTVTKIELRLRDNSRRLCRDWVAGIWEVEVKAFNSKNEILGELILTGSPEGVFSIQLANGF